MALMASSNSNNTVELATKNQSNGHQQDLESASAANVNVSSASDQCKGTWAHAAYHLTSATAGPPLLSLPYSMANLGWVPGIVALAFSALISYYACYSLSLAMEEMEQRGKRSLRFSHLSEHLIGSSLTRLIITPLQLSVCFMVVIGSIILGGQTLKGVYYIYKEDTSLQLYMFIIVFGSFVLILGQLPSMHSLRHFNMLSIVLCFGFTICTFAGSLIAGLSKEAPQKDYTIQGSNFSMIFGVFTSISVMVTSYSNPIVVEIQASLKEPVEKKMVKGLGVCYSIAVCTFFPVSIVGYWAFGNKANGLVLLNMLTPKNVLLVPRWLYFLANACACLQLIVYTVLHLHPTFERLDGIPSSKEGRSMIRIMIVRILKRSSFMLLSIILAAMLPFFVDFSAFVGAVGFTPICIILPMLFYNMIFQPPLKTISFWVNNLIIIVAIIIMILGCVASLHGIVSDAQTYKLFANV